MPAIAYVDSLNLYYRALKNTAHKWLNIELLLQNVCPAEFRPEHVKFFTAPVSGRDNPGAPARQKTYFDALQTVTSVQFIYGHMQNKRKRRPMVNPPLGEDPYVWVHDTEEKRTDVNIAAHMVFDACKGHATSVVLLSNDSDLTEPTRMVTEELGLPLLLVCPEPRGPSKQLSRYATTVIQLTRQQLAGAQLPRFVETQGVRRRVVTRPDEWR